MPNSCPSCQAESLPITDKLELPPDIRSHEIALQVIDCTDCAFAGIAVYEESRPGELDRVSFEHTGYRVSPDELERDWGCRVAWPACRGRRGASCGI